MPLLQHDIERLCLMQFVGTDREQVVRDLVAAFERVRDGNGPEAHCLVGRIGLGKTRIVQELFSRLAADQADPQYWPTRIWSGTPETQQPRKVVYPNKFAVQAAASLSFFWWGFSCGGQSRGDTLEEGYDQIFIHAAALAESVGWTSRMRRSAQSGWTPRMMALGAIVGFFVGPVGTATTVAGLVAQARDGGRGFRAARRRRREALSDRVVHVSEIDRGDRIEELAAALAMYSAEAPRLPVVLVLDDAHAAHPNLVRLISLLMANDEASVLVLATAWPERLQSDVGVHGSFAEWISLAPPDRHHRIDLMELAEPAMLAMVDEVAAATPLQTKRAVIERAAGNPYVLELMLGLRHLRRSIVDDAITLSPGEILSSIPDEIRGLYALRWEELPANVQDALSVAAVQGERFNEECVAHGCADLGFDEPHSAIGLAVDRYAWVRHRSASLRAFVEPVHYLISAGGRLSLAELGTVRSSIEEFIRQSNLGEKWAAMEDIDRAHLLEVHVSLANNDLVRDLAAAGVSAGRLAEFRARDYEFGEAVSLMRQALEWQASTETEEWRQRNMVVSWLGQSGRVDEAISEAERLLEDQRRSRSFDREIAVRTRMSYAEWLVEAGKFSQAKEVLGSVLRQLPAIHGPRHPWALWTRNALASLLAQAGDLTEAVRISESLLPDLETALGRDDVSTLRVRNNLAVWLGRLGQVDRAVAESETLLHELVSLRGWQDASTLDACGGLAWNLAHGGRLDQALVLFESLIERESNVLGTDHPTTLRTRNDYAQWLGEAGYYDQAIAACEALLADRLRVLGPDHPDTLLTRSSLAFWLGNSGSVEAAIDQTVVLLEYERSVLGEEHPSVLASEMNLAHWLGEAGRDGEAVALLRKSVRDHERVHGPDHPQTLRARNNLAVLLSEGDSIGEDVVDQLGTILADSIRVLGPNHPDTLARRCNLASVRGRSGDAAGAAVDFEGVVSDMVQVMGAKHPTAMHARSNLAVWLYEADRVGDSVATLEGLVVDLTEVFGPEHSRTKLHWDLLTTVRDELVNREAPGASK